jgi:uncharacterized protein (TIGR04255 family)
MSKLPHAPLIEVIFELHWPSGETQELEKFTMMLGAIHMELEKDFPKVEPLQLNGQIPLNMLLDQPTHRFMGNTTDNRYPLFQLGPGVLTVNTIDSKYDWKTFSMLIQKIAGIVRRKFAFQPSKNLSLSLKYVDFYKIDDTSVDLRKIYTKLFNFNLDIKSAVPEHSLPLILNLESAYQTKEGIFSFSIKRGKLQQDSVSYEGFVFENGLKNDILANAESSVIFKWINESHEFLSTFFKEITNGETYESFK